MTNNLEDRKKVYREVLQAFNDSYTEEVEFCEKNKLHGKKKPEYIAVLSIWHTYIKFGKSPKYSPYMRSVKKMANELHNLIISDNLAPVPNDWAKKAKEKRVPFRTIQGGKTYEDKK